MLAIQHWQTKRGADVYFVASRQLPMVDISVVFNAGSARDGIHSGLAYLTQALLDQGTKTLNVDQIADRFERIGAIYSHAVDRDKAIFHLRSMSDSHLSEAIQTMTYVLSQASFPHNACMRAQKNLRVALQEQQQIPEQIAMNAFYHDLYTDHPYAQPVLGTTETVDTITDEDIIHFYREFYVAKNATIAIVGDLSLEKARALSEELLNTLPSGSAAPALPDPSITTKKNKTNTVHAIAYPSQQTTLIIGALGTNYQDPDYLALLVGNYSLGGSALTSRLFHRVRNEQGLCYGISSQFIPHQVTGPFFIQLQTRTQQASKALHETEQILKQFSEQGPTIDELRAAQRALLGRLPLLLASNEGILNLLELIGFYHLPLDYLEKYRKSVSQLTLQRIHSAYLRRIEKNKLIVVSVGVLV